MTPAEFSDLRRILSLTNEQIASFLAVDVEFVNVWDSPAVVFEECALTLVLDGLYNAAKSGELNQDDQATIRYWMSHGLDSLVSLALRRPR